MNWHYPLKITFLHSNYIYMYITNASSMGFLQRPPPDPMILFIPALCIREGGIISAMLLTIPWHIERVTFPRLWHTMHIYDRIRKYLKLENIPLNSFIYCWFAKLLPDVTPTNVPSCSSDFRIMSFSEQSWYNLHQTVICIPMIRVA